MVDFAYIDWPLCNKQMQISGGVSGEMLQNSIASSLKRHASRFINEAGLMPNENECRVKW